VQKKSKKFFLGVAQVTGTAVILCASSVSCAELASSAGKLPAVIGSDEILKTGGSLLLIVASIIVVGWLYSRLKGNHARNGGFIRVLATQPLGPKERVLLIEVADQQLVLGVTATRIQTLHVLQQPVSIATREPLTAGFAERLRMAISGAQS